MKRKYTITVAGMDLNVLSEEAPEVVEAVVAAIDRRIREINLRSPRCSRTEAALLCALDYCCEKNSLSARLKEIEAKGTEIHGMEERIKALGELLEGASAEKQTLAEKVASLEASLEAAQSSVAELTQSVNDMSARLAAEEEERGRLEQALEVAETALEQMYLDEAPEEIEIDDEIEIVELEDEEVAEEVTEEVTEEAEAVPETDAPEIPDIIAEELAGQLEIKTPCEVIKAVGEDEVAPEIKSRKRGRAAKDTASDGDPAEEQITLDPPAPHDTSKRPPRARRTGDMFDMLSFDDI